MRIFKKKKEKPSWPHKKAEKTPKKQPKKQTEKRLFGVIPGEPARAQTETPKKFQWRGDAAIDPHTGKFHVPGLRRFHRTLAFIALIINFAISQFTLMGPSQNQVFAVFFGINAYICLRYVWKTRRKEGLDY